MHRHSRLDISMLVVGILLLCCGGTGCVFEGGHVMRRAWFDYNTLGTPAIFLEEIHHLPLRSSRTDQLRWMYNQSPTLTYDKIGMKAYQEKQQAKSWVLEANKHLFENGDAGPARQKSSDSLGPVFVPPAPEKPGPSRKKTLFKQPKSPVLKSPSRSAIRKPLLAPPPSNSGKKKSNKGPVALRLQR